MGLCCRLQLYIQWISYDERDTFLINWYTGKTIHEFWMRHEEEADDEEDEKNSEEDETEKDLYEAED